MSGSLNVGPVALADPSHALTVSRKSPGPSYEFARHVKLHCPLHPIPVQRTGVIVAPGAIFGARVGLGAFAFFDELVSGAEVDAVVDGVLHVGVPSRMLRSIIARVFTRIGALPVFAI